MQYYTHIILDEIHERSTETDFTLLVVRRLTTELPQTKVVVMSATMQGDMLVDYFRESFTPEEVCPPYHVGAKRFPVRSFFVEELADLVKEKNSIWSPKQIDSRSKLKFMAAKWPYKTLKSVVQLRPKVCPEAMDICTEVIVTQAELGEAVLVFLPGIAEISHYYDHLTFELSEKNLEKEFVVFILHSQVPFEDQQQVFRAPPPDVIHVILATNIAESSITLPKLTLVVNFAIYRRLGYDTKRRISCLTKHWCSRASCAQRAGRVGRVCPGVAVHLVSRKFYESILKDYDPPHILSAPLAKLVLHAKDIGSRLGIPSPSEFLSYAIQPPSLEQMNVALQDLADLGAVTCSPRYSRVPEQAEITLLGHFSLALPVCLELCRLVLYGVLFGVALDAIVMAAGASLPQDVFSLPCRMVMKNDIAFQSSLWRSLLSRINFDRGQYSESLMLCNVFREWMSFKMANQGTRKYPSKHKLVVAFCSYFSLRWEQLLLFESTVTEITLRVLHHVPVNSALHRQLQDLLAVTRYRHHTHSTAAAAEEEVRFCEEPLILKALLTATFSHQLLYGERTIDSAAYFVKKKSLALLEAIEGSNFTQQRMLILPDMRKSHLPHLAQLLSLVLPDKTCYFDVLSGVGIVQFTQPDDEQQQKENDSAGRNSKKKKNTKSKSPFVVDEYEACEVFYREKSVVRLKLPPDAMLFWQFCERCSGGWRVQGIPTEFPRPMHPLRTLWCRISRHKDTTFSGSWRNPAGFVCELHQDCAPFLGLATCLQGSENVKSVNVKGVTVLPTLLDSPVALLMCLAFQSQYVHMELLVSEGEHVSGVKIHDSQEIMCYNERFITVDDLIRVNALRSALSLALSFYSPNGDLPVSDVANISALLRCMVLREPLRPRPHCHAPSSSSSSSSGRPLRLSSIAKVLSWEQTYPREAEAADDFFEEDVDEDNCSENEEEKPFLQEFEFPTLADFVYFPPLQSSLLSRVEEEEEEEEEEGGRCELQDHSTVEQTALQAAAETDSEGEEIQVQESDTEEMDFLGVSETEDNNSVCETEDNNPVRDSEDVQTVCETGDVQTVCETGDDQTVCEPKDVQTVCETGDDQTVCETEKSKTVCETGDVQTVCETGDDQTVCETEKSKTVRETEDVQTVSEPKDDQTVSETEKSKTVCETGDDQMAPLSSEEVTPVHLSHSGSSSRFELSPHAPVFLPTKLKQASAASKQNPSHHQKHQQQQQQQQQQQPSLPAPRSNPSIPAQRTLGAPPPRADCSSIRNLKRRQQTSGQASGQASVRPPLPYLDPATNHLPTFPWLYPSSGPHLPFNTYSGITQQAPPLHHYMERYQHPSWVANMYRDPSLPLAFPAETLYTQPPNQPQLMVATQNPVQPESTRPPNQPQLMMATQNPVQPESARPPNQPQLMMATQNPVQPESARPPNQPQLMMATQNPVQPESARPPTQMLFSLPDPVVEAQKVEPQKKIKCVSEAHLVNFYLFYLSQLSSPKTANLSFMCETVYQEYLKCFKIPVSSSSGEEYSLAPSFFDRENSFVVWKNEGVKYVSLAPSGLDMVRHWLKSEKLVTAELTAPHSNKEEKPPRHSSPSSDHPTSEEPRHSSPSPDHPTSEEPRHSSPSPDHPTSEEPRHSSPSPDQRTSEEPRHSSPSPDQRTSEEPRHSSPSPDQRTSEEPRHSSPSPDQRTSEEPRHSSPSPDQRTSEEPRHSSPSPDQRTSEEPRHSSPSSDHPTSEEPRHSSPSSDHPTSEEPRHSSPSPDHPTSEEPRHSSPSPDQRTSEEPRHSSPSPDQRTSEEPRHSSPSPNPCQTEERNDNVCKETGSLAERVAETSPSRKPLQGRDLDEDVVKFLCRYLLKQKHLSCTLRQVANAYKKAHHRKHFWLDLGTLELRPEFICSSKRIKLKPAYIPTSPPRITQGGRDEDRSKDFKLPLRGLQDTEQARETGKKDSGPPPPPPPPLKRLNDTTSKDPPESCKENERPYSLVGARSRASSADRDDGTATREGERPELSKLDDNVLRVLCQHGRKAFLSELLRDSKLNRLCWEIGTSLSENYFTSRPHLFTVESGMNLDLPVEDAVISLSSSAPLLLLPQSSSNKKSNRPLSPRQPQRRRQGRRQHPSSHRRKTGKY